MAVPDLKANIDDNDLTNVSISSASESQEGQTGDTREVVFTVTLSQACEAEVKVDWETRDGSAKAGTDYVATSGTVVFPENSTDAQSIRVRVNGDDLVEGDETFLVKLSNPRPNDRARILRDEATRILRDEAKGTIVDDDGATISISDASPVTEGNAGATTVAKFTVTLSQPSATPVTVNWKTADDTTTAPGDYIEVSSTVTFPANSTEQMIEVTVIGDDIVEPTETFLVKLSIPVGATILRGEAKGTIEDDDGATISISDASPVTEGDAGTATVAKFTVTLSKASQTEIKVDWVTADTTPPSAVGGTDYVVANSTLSFPPGQTSRTIEVTVIGDNQVEPIETFLVKLSNPVGAIIDPDP